MSYIYVHIPFCRKKCPYCNFVSSANKDNTDNYIELLKTEIAIRKNSGGKTYAKTCYFGGGTPSLLGIDRLNNVISYLRRFFHIDQTSEITLEANPSDLNPVFLSELKSIGINRISIGVQSFKNKDLEFLQRTHTASDAKEAIVNAHKVGFDNISIDLIYGFRSQTKTGFIDNLKMATSLPITHISIYALSVEEGTPFYYRQKNGKKISVSDELAAEIYINSVNFLKKNGFDHYEISNFAKKNYQSKHNINYWKEGEYWGFGLSASSYLKYERIKNLERYIHYAGKLSNGELPIESIERLSRDEKMSEELILALRLIKGINWSEFKNKYGNLKEFGIIEDKVEQWISIKMLKMENGYLSLSFPKGILLSNEIFSDLL